MKLQSTPTCMHNCRSLPTHQQESRSIGRTMPRSKPAEPLKTRTTPNITSHCQPRKQAPTQEPTVLQGLKKCTNDKLESPYLQLNDKTTALAQIIPKKISLQTIHPRISGRRKNPKQKSTNHNRCCAAPQPSETRPHTGPNKQRHTYKESPPGLQKTSQIHTNPHHKSFCEQEREHTEYIDWPLQKVAQDERTGRTQRRESNSDRGELAAAYAESGTPIDREEATRRRHIHNKSKRSRPDSRRPTWKASRRRPP